MKIVTPKSDNPDDPVVNPDFVAPDKPVDPIKSLIDPELEKNNQPAEDVSNATVKKFNKPPMSKKPMTSLLVAILVIIILIGAGFAIYAVGHRSSTSPKAINTATTVSGKATITPSCGSKNCFTASFANCTPATLTSDSSVANIKYQIIGKGSSGCSMSFEYLQTPVSDWINQSMTCDFNNSQTLDNAVALVFNSLASKTNTYNCTGSLEHLLETQ